MKKFRPITVGDRFGRWTALEDRKRGKRELRVRCDCGTERRVYAGSLLNDASHSCGRCGLGSENRSAAARKLMQDPARRAAVSAVHKGKSISAQQRARMAERKGELNGNWKGGRTPHGASYVYLRVGLDHPMANPRGYALEHRIVMAQHLGRTLRPEEVVHHINGVKDDNRIENLSLFASHTEHVKHHAMLRRATFHPRPPTGTPEP